MRILLELEALKDQTVGSADFHKLQGFMYEHVIGSTAFSSIHDKKNYKFFCFSNIFPPAPVRTGEKRNILFSSPDRSLTEVVFAYMKEACEQGRTINIGEQSYKFTSASVIMLSVGEKCTIKTSTPITARLPERRYCDFAIPEDDRKEKFLYWRKHLPMNILIDLVESNLWKKFVSFTKRGFERMSLIDEFMFLREIIVHVPIGQNVVKVPASFWKFSFSNLDKNRRTLLEFALDTGLGERNSFGFGFLNVEHGARYTYVRRTGNTEMDTAATNNKAVPI